VYSGSIPLPASKPPGNPPGNPPRNPDDRSPAVPARWMIFDAPEVYPKAN
jgi:hypothetical protein